MGNAPSNLPPDRTSGWVTGPIPLSSDSSYEETYISPGGFETPKTDISICETETKPTVTPEPELPEPEPTYVDAVEEKHEEPLNSQTVYTFSNLNSGAAIDVSGGDRKNIIGWPLHGAENQLWQLIQHGEGHAIYNPGSKQYLHLTIDEGENRMVASRSPVTWLLQRVDGKDQTYRILWHDTNLSLYLEDGTPGTKVQIKRTDVEDKRQLWKLTPSGYIGAKQEPTDIRRRSLPPQVIDTVISLEGNSKTVRTTTTVTTITTVTEVPCAHCPS